MQRFALAPMCGLIRGLTLVLLAIPALLLAGHLAGYPYLQLPLVFFILTYAWVWLRFRPKAFIVDRDAITVLWPLKRRRLPRNSITAARLLGREALNAELGWAVRVGAGGLWGGFGRLWSRRRGWVQLYVSRRDQLVWIERGEQRPWLISPENPERFIALLASDGSPG